MKTIKKNETIVKAFAIICFFSVIFYELLKLNQPNKMENPVIERNYSFITPDGNMLKFRHVSNSEKNRLMQNFSPIRIDNPEAFLSVPCYLLSNGMVIRIRRNFDKGELFENEQAYNISKKGKLYFDVLWLYDEELNVYPCFYLYPALGAEFLRANYGEFNFPKENKYYHLTLKNNNIIQVYKRSNTNIIDINWFENINYYNYHYIIGKGDDEEIEEEEEEL